MSISEELRDVSTSLDMTEVGGKIAKG